jgi:hypothetical protein
MTLFHRIEDAQIIVRRRGVYKQCPLYHRNGLIYAGVSGGFVQVLRNGSTTQPDTAWLDVYDPLGLVFIMANKEPRALTEHMNGPKLQLASCPGS